MCPIGHSQSFTEIIVLTTQTCKLHPIISTEPLANFMKLLIVIYANIIFITLGLVITL